MWKSGKQAAPSLSTAESELTEAVEGMVIGDSVDVLVQEVSEHVYSRLLKVDNTAAVNLLTEASGSWRTRHLRLKASHIRRRLGRLDWMVESVPGQQQIADVGTKAMLTPRLEELKKMMSMGSYETEEKVEEKKVKEEPEERKSKEEKAVRSQKDEVVKILKVIVALGCVHQVKAQGEEALERTGVWEFVVMVVFALIGMMRIL